MPRGGCSAHPTAAEQVLIHGFKFKAKTKRLPKVMGQRRLSAWGRRQHTGWLQDGQKLEQDGRCRAAVLVPLGTEQQLGFTAWL